MAIRQHSMLVIGTGAPKELRARVMRGAPTNGTYLTGMQLYAVLGKKRLCIGYLHKYGNIRNRSEPRLRVNDPVPAQLLREMHMAMAHLHPLGEYPFRGGDLAYTLEGAVIDLHAALVDDDPPEFEHKAASYGSQWQNVWGPQTGGSRAFRTLLRARLAFYRLWLSRFPGAEGIDVEENSAQLKAALRDFGHGGITQNSQLTTPAVLKREFAEPLETHLRTQGFRIPVLVAPEVVEDVGSATLSVDVDS